MALIIFRYDPKPAESEVDEAYADDEDDDEDNEDDDDDDEEW